MKGQKRNGKKERRQQWPYVRWAAKEKSWLVDTRTKEGGQRRFFKTKEEADAWAVKQRVKRGNEGAMAFNDSELSKFGWTTRDAVKFALEHLRGKSRSVPMKEAVAQFVAFKTDRVRARRLVDLKQKLKQLSKAIGGDRIMAEITADDLTAALDAIRHPTTRNGFRKELVALWRFSRSKPREWTTVVLDNITLPVAQEGEKARTILSVAQARRLMEASADPEVRALNAMVLFGGLRREEVEKLDWSAVDFRTNHINVSSEVSKVQRERFCPMPPNLRSWLRALPDEARARRQQVIEDARRAGKEFSDEELERNPVVTRTLMHVFRRTWKKAGIYPWPQDAHRHSFISHRRVLVGDAQTALEAGTSEGIIKRHYKRPVLKTDAKAYFQITPPRKILNKGG